MKKIVSLLLAVLAVIGLTGCSDGASQNEQEWNDPDFSIETSLNEITFLAPSNWRSKVSEDSNKIYYYPYESNSDGMLYICCEEDSSVSATPSETFLNSFLNSFSNAMKKNKDVEVSDFSEKEFLEIFNCPAVKVKFSQTMNGVDGESLMYAFLTNSSVYSVIAMEAGGLSEEFEEVAEDFVGNIQVAENAQGTSEASKQYTSWEEYVRDDRFSEDFAFEEAGETPEEKRFTLTFQEVENLPSFMFDAMLVSLIIGKSYENYGLGEISGCLFVVEGQFLLATVKADTTMGFVTSLVIEGDAEEEKDIRDAYNLIFSSTDLENLLENLMESSS